MKSQRMLLGLMLCLVLAGVVVVVIQKPWPSAETAPVNAPEAAAKRAPMAMPAASAPMPASTVPIVVGPAASAKAKPAPYVDIVAAQADLQIEQAELQKLILARQARQAAATTPGASPKVSSTQEDADIAAMQTDVQAKQAAIQKVLDARRPQIPEPPKSGDPSTTDWGEIKITDGVPISLTTSTGDPVTITPKLLPDGTVQMRMVIKHTEGNATYGTTTNIVAQPGQSVSITLGNQSFKMTPTL